MIPSLDNWIHGDHDTMPSTEEGNAMPLGYDPELPAGYQDADIEQAEFIEQSRRYASRLRASRRATDPAKQARLCPHGGGYPLKSIAAERAADPRHGEDGFRCSDCGSVLSGDPWDEDVKVLYPSEDVQC